VRDPPTTLGVILGYMFVKIYYRTHRNDQLVARVGTDMPQKNWDRAGYDWKGQQKGQHLGSNLDFRRPPPGVVEPRGWCVGAPLHLSNLFSG